jgi:hypothetical protein
MCLDLRRRISKLIGLVAQERGLTKGREIGEHLMEVKVLGESLIE